jgi:transcription elongation factor GreB
VFWFATIPGFTCSAVIAGISDSAKQVAFVSRYRPPAEKSTPLITPAGFDKLQAELKALWVRRRDVTAALSAAAAEGDRSENAEYIYRKKELREIDRRVRYLQKRTAELKVVHDKPSDQSRVFFGALVELEDEDGERSQVRIVGPDEIDPSCHWISVDSLVARALLKSAVDDEVTVTAPGGEKTYTVEKVSYES